MLNCECLMMNEKNVVIDKSYCFALKIIALYKMLCNEKKEYVLSKQLLRSGTSIGANVNEAQAAISKKDFIAKMSISSKEARECKYWLMLLKDSEYIDVKVYGGILNDIDELVKILTSIVKSAQEKQLK